jgi:hypothetical protein
MKYTILRVRLQSEKLQLHNIEKELTCVTERGLIYV